MHKSAGRTFKPVKAIKSGTISCFLDNFFGNIIPKNFLDENL